MHALCSPHPFVRLRDPRSARQVLAAAAGAALLALPALLLADTATVKWSDASKPGLLRIHLGQGDIRIRGVDAADTVTASSSAKSKSAPKTRTDGMRVLGDTSGGFSLSEKDNVAELTMGRDSLAEHGADFTIEVPRATALDIQLGWGGDVRVAGIAGDISARTISGSVRLEDVRGGVSLETMSGDIDVRFAALPADKPVAITSMNGTVKIQAPADAKANVRFRTHNGTIMTDFPETVLITKTEDQGSAGWGSYAGAHVKVAAQIAGEVGREIGRTAREIAEEVRAAVREHRAAEDEARKAAHEAEETRVEAGAAAAAAPAPAAPAAPAVAPAPAPAPAPAATVGSVKAPRPPRPPRPPSIPAIVGGKVISGPLNGGGIDLQATTMNGDIVLKKR